MDGEIPDAMKTLGLPRNDSELDREIARALNVDPSPEFLARVRMRVASEPAPAPWPLRWMVLAGAAVAVVVMAAVVTLWPVADQADPQQAALPDLALPLERPAAPAPPPPAVVETAPGGTPRTVPSRAQLAHVEVTTAGVPGDSTAQHELPPFPEVLISADEVRAYRLLLGITEQQRLPTPPPARADTGGVDLQDIGLASLRIEALPPMARLEGDRP